MPSFDAVVEPNRVELRNAIDQCVREIGTRFDFKGTKAAVEYDDDALTLVGDSDFQLGQVRDIVLAKLAKRSVDARFVDFSAEPEKGGGDTWRLNAPIKSGIGSEDAKRLQQADQAEQAEGAGGDPGRHAARVGHQERRPAGHDAAAAPRSGRVAARLQEFPRLMVPHARSARCPRGARQWLRAAGRH